MNLRLLFYVVEEATTTTMRSYETNFSFLFLFIKSLIFVQHEKDFFLHLWTLLIFKKILHHDLSHFLLQNNNFYSIKQFFLSHCRMKNDLINRISKSHYYCCWEASCRHKEKEENFREIWETNETLIANKDIKKLYPYVHVEK